MTLKSADPDPEPPPLFAHCADGVPTWYCVPRHGSPLEPEPVTCAGSTLPAGDEALLVPSRVADVTSSAASADAGATASAVRTTVTTRAARAPGVTEGIAAQRY